METYIRILFVVSLVLLAFVLLRGLLKKERPERIFDDAVWPAVPALMTLPDVLPQWRIVTIIGSALIVDRMGDSPWRIPVTLVPMIPVVILLIVFQRYLNHTSS